MSLINKQIPSSWSWEPVVISVDLCKKRAIVMSFGNAQLSEQVHSTDC